MSKPKKRPPSPEDIEFSASFTPRHGRGLVSLTGYKWSIYLEIARNGCCPQSTECIEIPLGGADFDKLIGMLRRAKKAASKVTRHIKAMKL